MSPMMAQQAAEVITCAAGRLHQSISVQLATLVRGRPAAGATTEKLVFATSLPHHDHLSWYSPGVTSLLTAKSQRCLASSQQISKLQEHFLASNVCCPAAVASAA